MCIRDRLLEAALAAGVQVTVLPGPSAVETALVASGLGAAQYRFVGYLPRREAELHALWEELRGWEHAVVAFESPRRLPRALRELARVDPERRLAVCRELTKRYEEVVRGTAAELADRFREPPKGEVTLVVAAAAAAPSSSSPAGAAAATTSVTSPLGGSRNRSASSAAVPRTTSS